MDRLRSPGGCPWDAEQTHESLVPYALEEVYELVEAVETGDRAGLREELGDLLLQVVFHARLARSTRATRSTSTTSRRTSSPSCVRRHPHVFARRRRARRGRRARAVGPDQEGGEAARRRRSTACPLALPRAGPGAEARRARARPGRRLPPTHGPPDRRTALRASGCSRSSSRRTPRGVDAEGALRRTRGRAGSSDLRAARSRAAGRVRRTCPTVRPTGRTAKALAAGRRSERRSLPVRRHD